MVGVIIASGTIAQTTLPEFEHGELIIGYTSGASREKAVQELNEAARRLKVRGDDVEDMRLQKIGTSALKVKIKLPTSVRGDAAKDSAFELQLLRETADNIKRSDGRVLYAHPNWILRTNRSPPRVPLDVRPLEGWLRTQSVGDPGTPDDYAFVRGLHWSYSKLPVGINAVGAWKSVTGSKDVVVAVIDTGLVADHPDIVNSGNVITGYNFVSATGRGPDPRDPGLACIDAGETAPSWHGTLVAGIVGAAGSNNKRGITGINWDVSVIPVRAVGTCGGSLVDIVDGMRWAAGLPVDGVPPNERPADIINLSLGGVIPCTAEQAGLMIDALAAIRAAGTVVVVAAGNDGLDVNATTPAGCSGVISVAAADKDGRLGWYSNHGKVTIMAPGGDMKVKLAEFPAGVWSTIQTSPINPEGIEPEEGTSMAAPHVTGALALALAKHPEWRRKPELIERKLISTAVAVANERCASPCGAGQLEAERLVNAP
ncbi:S8 family serine peptidase [Bradyrhizobium sp. Bra78]|uniref:S8 family serine peptidase n=1 Tax=Bradyrhizobium sp. Bra78 TaxID=2926010 RepID=UPI0021C83E49|nr:S8 family serine peptidase [Bradyrhizobium sp. Bra78]